ncbi:hypothetical protein ABRG53_2371 [Pseudanabaena sp. ABRG5-3]|nr:hypothetical protein ABRG53_2371 [Pseudanabaena sp. ABRG5-3]
MRTVSGAFSVLESAALGLADAEGEAVGDVEAVAVLDGEAEGDAEGLALALLLGVADTDGEAAVDVVVVVVVGVQETAATEILAAIARLYNENFFINIIKS